MQFSDAEFLIKAAANTTGGAFSIIEEIAPLDTPLHVREHEDEIFYILEREHIIEVGHQTFEVGPGDLVFGPRGVPHAQRRVVARAGRLLALFTPSGFEGFLRDLAEAERAGEPQAAAYARVSTKYAITWLDR